MPQLLIVKMFSFSIRRSHQPFGKASPIRVECILWDKGKEGGSGVRGQGGGEGELQDVIVSTRWNSQLLCMRSCLKSEGAIRVVLGSEEFRTMKSLVSWLFNIAHFLFYSRLGWSLVNHKSICWGGLPRSGAVLWCNKSALIWCQLYQWGVFKLLEGFFFFYF